jgi:hypothetical protein
MRVFEETKNQAEQEKLLQLMNKIERNPTITQRALASELGIALGLLNAYLKKCIIKGWIKAGNVSAKRLVYLLTPEGFVEKSRIVGDYLSKSFTLFRDAKRQCEAIFELCKEMGWTKIAIVGEGDLADIATLVAHGIGLSVEKIGAGRDLASYDAVLITDMDNPQNVYDDLSIKVDSGRLLVLDLLHISRQNMF